MLTAAARPVLRGETSLMLRRPPVRQRKKKSTRVSTGAASPAWMVGSSSVDSPTFAAEDALFQSLRQWRAERAREQGVPAYAILHDRVLREIATLRPDSLDALATINGIGTVKIERYGQGVLAVVNHSG